MNEADAREMLRPALPSGPGRWAELGAGQGTFTIALATLLGPQGEVIALDRDAGAVRALGALGSGSNERARVRAVHGDFTEPGDLAALGAPLDGVLFANALHFVAEPHRVLATAASHVLAGGRVVIVEYDRSRPNPWVPHPIPADRLAGILRDAGLGTPAVVARRPSVWHREMYCAWVEVPALRAAGVAR